MPSSPRVDVSGSRFQDHPAGVAQQPVGGAQHDCRHDQRRDPVGALEAGEQDRGAGERRGDEGSEVGRDVLEGALEVEALAVGPEARVSVAATFTAIPTTATTSTTAPVTAGGATRRRTPS